MSQPKKKQQNQPPEAETSELQSESQSPLAPDTPTPGQASESPKSQPQKTTTAPDISSNKVEPDWDSITTPEEMAAELEAEAEAVEVDSARAAFDATAKKGLHLIMGGMQKGSQFGLKMKTGYSFPELDLKNHEPALETAAHCAYELMDIDPNGWFGKFLNFAGNIDERYIPIIAYGSGLTEAIKAGTAEIARLNKEAENKPETPIGAEGKKKADVVPIDGKEAPSAPETTISVVQP